MSSGCQKPTHGRAVVLPPALQASGSYKSQSHAHLNSTLAAKGTAHTSPTYRVRAVPLHLRDANEFVAQHHRHNLPTVGGKFAVGAADDDGNLIGVAVAGCPVARRLDAGSSGAG